MSQNERPQRMKMNCPAIGDRADEAPRGRGQRAGRAQAPAAGPTRTSPAGPAARCVCYWRCCWR
jgi:hypothetical protein